MPLQDRLSQLKQVNPQKQRLVADLPPSMLLQGINNILAGKNSSNPQANTLIRQLAAQGKTPEQVMQAFIENQRKSQNPLVILG
jgi:DNA polymerase III gamma/tau subunit